MSSIHQIQSDFFGMRCVCGDDPDRLKSITANEGHPDTAKILDELGILSGKDQGLKGPITSAEKLSSSDNTILLWTDFNDIPKGFLKYGRKKLYFYKKNGEVVQVDSVFCVLDFYVHESCQRQGIGRELFDDMIEKNNISPGSMAYDRPSEKLIPFLRKHFNLKFPDLQPNRYAIFPDEGFIFP